MKKIIKTAFVLLTLLVSTTIRAQEEITFADLKQMVTVINSKLPLSMGMMMEWQSMEIDKEQLTLRYSVNDVGNTISRNLITDEEMKEQFRITLGGLGNEMGDFLHVVNSFGINTLFVLISENTGDSKRLLVTAQEMEEALNTEVSSEEILQLQIKNTQKTLPLSIGNGMNLTEVKLTSTYMVNTVTVDESIFSMDQMISNKNSMREVMVQMIAKNSDLSVTMQLMLCADTGRGYSYIYKGNTTGKMLRIDLTNEQLMEIFNSMVGEE